MFISQMCTCEVDIEPLLQDNISRYKPVLSEQWKQAWLFRGIIGDELLPTYVGIMS